jgi:membrane protein implicated in regulation of membrane protease activity
MSEATLWWIVSGILVGIELLTGTFYLLMLALGAASAGLCALLGLSATVQFACAAAVGGGAVYLWHRKLLKRGVLDVDDDVPTGLGSLDVGEEVLVEAWNPDGSTVVKYRGSDWRARYQGAHVPSVGPHRIKAIKSNQLVLERL